MKIKAFLMLAILTPALLTPCSAEVSELLPVENLAVPKSLGLVSSRFQGSSPRWVIQIQDIHAHQTAQENIAALITHFNEVYGIQAVGVEGGWSSTSLPKSWALPSSRGKQALAQALLEQDYITGPTFAALFSKTPVTLAGIEDKTVYSENRDLYLKFLQNRADTLQKITVLERKIEEAKSNLYNPALLEFDKKFFGFKDGKKADVFIPYALRLAAEKGVALEDLKEVEKFSRVLEIQKTIDPEKLDAEAKRLLETFKYAHLSFEELLKSGKVPAEKLEFYPQSKKYFELMRDQDGISHRGLFNEIDEVIKRLKGKLIQTSDETELDHRAMAFHAAKQIVSLQASRADLKSYELYRAPLATDLTRENLIEALETGLQFYAAAQKRDQIFFDRITTDPALQGNVAVVTGGFHTEGLSEKLENAGISYFVITPDLGEKPEPADEKTYFERMAETVSLQTLSEKGDRDLTPSFDAGFARGVEEYDSGERNLSKVTATAMTYQIGPASEGLQGAISSADRGASFSIANMDDQSLKELLLQSQEGVQKVTAIIKMSELKDHLDHPERGPLNKAALSAFVKNPKNFLIVTGNPGDADEMLLGKRNVKILNRPLEDLVRVEKDKLKDPSVRLAVVDNTFSQRDSKLVSVKPYSGIFGTLRLILEDSRFSSPKAIELLMERAVALLQDLYSIQAASTSA